MRPLLGKTPQHCKNSAQLAKDLASVVIYDDEILISHDVVALFTKTPVDATLHIVRQRLEADRTLKKRTKLSVDDIMKLLTFVTKSTYFQFNGVLYKQIEGFAMGDPLSAIMSNLFMEDLEQNAIPSAPAECALSLWKRYVDDIIEKIKRGTIQALTDHLNIQDPTGNIKFTCEQEKELQLPFLDIKLIRNADGSIRLKIYRKATHTDQYLMFDSHHPIQHKLSVVRTLLNRKEDIITNEEDKQEEDDHIRAVLKTCKYPTWAIDRVQKEITDKKQGVEKPKRERSSEQKHRGRVNLPYVAGVTERIQRALKKRGIETPVRPHRTLRNVLVHPKDKIEDDKKCGVVYHVPCLNCDNVYIGETGRKLQIRIKEHKDECDKKNSTIKTRSKSITEDTSEFKSAISEHCRDKNHLMNWSDISIIDRENDRHRRLVKEAIQVRKLKEGTSMNRDDGGHDLSHVWDPLLQPPPKPSGRSHPSHS